MMGRDCEKEKMREIKRSCERAKERERKRKGGRRGRGRENLDKYGN